MNFRTTYILFALVLTSLLAVILGLMFSGDSGDQEFVLQSFNDTGTKLTDITGLVIEQGTGDSKQTLVFAREKGGEWRMTKPYEARVDQALVNDIARDFLTAKTDTEEDIGSGKKVYGLAEPTVMVTLKKGDVEAWVKLGSVTPGTRESPVYFLSSDQPDEPQAVKFQALSRFLQLEGESDAARHHVRGLSAYRDLNLLGSGVNDPARQISKVEVSQGDKTLILERSTDGTWKYVEPANYGIAELQGGATSAGLGGVQPLLVTALAIRADSPDVFIEQPDNLAEFGLGSDAEGVLSVTITVPEAEPRQRTLLVGKPVEEGSTQRYAMLKGDSAVVKVADGNVKQIAELLAKPEQLRDRTLVRLTMPRIDAVDIQTGPTHVELLRLGQPGEWTLYDSSGAGRKANPMTINQTLSGLARPSLIRDFPSGQSDAEMGFDTPQAEVKLWADGVKPPEPKEDAQPAKPELKGEADVRLIFGKKSADLVYVRRIADGVTTDAMVPGTLLTEVTRDRLDFVDPSLPTFDAAKASGLTFDRDGEAYEVRKKEGGPADPAQAEWEILRPEKLKGRAADAVTISKILAGMAAMRPRKLIDDDPNDQTLERLGLTPEKPKSKVTISLGEGPDAENRVYLFGETSDTGGFFAKLGEGDLVFTVDPFVLTPIQTGNIQDMTVLAIARSNVTGLKVTGWNDVLPTTLTLEFVKKDNAWSAASDQQTAPNQEALRELIGTLSPLRAAAFVSYSEGAKPEYKLDLGQGALQLAVTVEGKEEPITLTLGATDPSGNQYYAQTSELPGDVFLIPAGMFQDLRARPKVLSE